MRILSKYKDYYDYLTGIYGEDNRLILDRREGVVLDPFYPHDIDKEYDVEFYICGWKILGRRFQNKYYFGEKLLSIGTLEISKNFPYRRVRFETIGRFGRKAYSYLPLEPLIDKEAYNVKEDCPILMKTGLNNFIHFPRLDEIGIASVFPPELLYQHLSLWLGAKLDERLLIKDDLTDVQKLQNKGFDKMTSFRPNIKSKN